MCHLSKYKFSGLWCRFHLWKYKFSGLQCYFKCTFCTILTIYIVYGTAKLSSDWAVTNFTSAVITELKLCKEYQLQFYLYKNLFYFFKKHLIHAHTRVRFQPRLIGLLIKVFVLYSWSLCEGCLLNEVVKVPLSSVFKILLTMYLLTPVCRSPTTPSYMSCLFPLYTTLSSAQSLYQSI